MENDRIAIYYSAWVVDNWQLELKRSVNTMSGRKSEKRIYISDPCSDCAKVGMPSHLHSVSRICFWESQEEFFLKYLNYYFNHSFSCFHYREPFYFLFLMQWRAITSKILSFPWMQRDGALIKDLAGGTRKKHCGTWSWFSGKHHWAKKKRPNSGLYYGQTK